MPIFKWISFENTNVLLRHDDMGQMFEWTPVGQVTLRQIYPQVPPRWYGFKYAEPRNDLACRSEGLEEAKRAVEVAASRD
jgi:hypothetical protein